MQTKKWVIWNILKPTKGSEQLKQKHIFWLLKYILIQLNDIFIIFGRIALSKLYSISWCSIIMLVRLDYESNTALAWFLDVTSNFSCVCYCYVKIWKIMHMRKYLCFRKNYKCYHRCIWEPNIKLQDVKHKISNTR